MTAYRTKARRPYVAPLLTLLRTYSIEETSRWRDPQWARWIQNDERRDRELSASIAASKRREAIWVRVGAAFVVCAIVATIDAVLRR